MRPRTRARSRDGSRRAGRVWPRLLVLVAVAAAAGFLTGVVVDRPEPPKMTVAGPGVAVGADRSVRSRDGAVAAAVDYATLLARLFPLGRATAERTAADVASEAYRPVLVAAVDRQLVPLQQQAGRLPGSTVYRQSVLATRLEAYQPDRAQVSVWVLATVGQVGGQATARVNPIGTFTTFTVELVWQRAGWRLDGTGQRPGPSPLLDGPPEQAEDFAAALDGFTDWRPA